MSKAIKNQEAYSRLLFVLDLLEQLGLKPDITDDMPPFALGAWSPHFGIRINKDALKMKFTAFQCDKLTYALLHELGHAVQFTTKFYPEAQEHSAQTFGSMEEYEEAVAKLPFPEATEMHLEHDAEAFAIDMCLRLGMPDVMRHVVYL